MVEGNLHSELLTSVDLFSQGTQDHADTNRLAVSWEL